MTTNTITNTTAEVYFLTDGSVRDSFNENGFHPLSNVNMVVVYIEDGTSTNVATINYAPDIRKNWATHWFPCFYRGLVEHTLDGELEPRSFAQYVTTVPNILLAMNQNSTSVMSTAVTVQQQSGSNLIGSYNTVSDLPTSYGDWEDLQDLEEANAVAYVWEAGTNGFYQVVYTSATTSYAWTLVTSSIQNEVYTKQYDVWTITVQPGYGNPAPITELTDEQYRLIWQEFGELTATIETYTLLVDGYEARIIALEDGTYEHPQLTLYNATGNAIATFDGTDVLFNYGGTTIKLSQITLLEDGTTVIPTYELFTNKKQDLTANSTVFYVSQAAIQTAINAISGTDQAYTDAEIAKIVNGTYTADKATKDALGNNIPATYATIVNDELKELLSNKKTVFSASDEFYPTVGLVLTALQTKEDVANKKTDLTDTTSDSFYASVKAIVTALLLKADQATTYTKTEIDNIVASVYKFKGVVALYSDLAAKEATAVAGDVWEVTSSDYGTNVNFAWTDEGPDSWDDIGGIEALATALNNGLMSSGDYSKLLALYTKAELDALLLLKTNIADIVNDVVTGGTEVPLSAQQGVVLKGEIDTNVTDIATNVTSIDVNKLKVIEQDKEIKDLKSQRSSANPSQSALVTQEITAKVDSLPKNAAEQPAGVKGYGLNLKQVVVNGNLVSSLSNVSAGRIILDTDGTIKQVYSYDNSARIFNVISGHKYFVKYIFTGTGTLRTSSNIGIQYETSSVLETDGILSADSKSIYTILTAGATENANFFVVGAGDGELIKQEIIIYNLGTNPLSLTASDLSTIPYFEGESHVTNPTVKTVGKNLFEEIDVSETSGELVYTKLSDTSFSIFADGFTYQVTSRIMDIDFKALTQYTFSGTVSEDIDKDLRFRIQYTDGTNDSFAVITSTPTAYSITSDVSKSIDYMTYIMSATGGTTTYTNFMINEGTTAVAWEAYKSNSITYFLDARSVRSVRDTWVGNVKTKYVEEVAVVGIVSVDDTEYPLALTGGAFTNYLTAGGQESGIIGTDSTTASGTLQYVLATPTTEEIETIGDVPKSYSQATVIQSDMIPDLAEYDSGITIEQTLSPIRELTYVAIIDFVTGLPTEVDLSNCTVASGGL